MILLVGIPVGYTAFSYVKSRNTAVVQNVPTKVEVPGTDLEEVVPNPDPQPENGTVSVEPEDPEPPPKPPPPKPKAPSVSGLVAKGWNQMSNPTAAAATFQKALNMKASHPEANYGYGYALLEQGNIADAKPYLCTANAGNDRDTTRETTSLLSKHSLTCP